MTKNKIKNKIFKSIIKRIGNKGLAKNFLGKSVKKFLLENSKSDEIVVNGYRMQLDKNDMMDMSLFDYFPTSTAIVKSNVKKNDIVSPGHIFPIISKEGGVLVRAGHTEASVDISKLAKKNPSAVICEIMNDRGVMAQGMELFSFAKKHKLKIGRIDDLIAYRLKVEKLIKFKKSDKILIKNQKYNIRIFENLLDGSENFALVKGDLKKNRNPRVRVISSNIVQNYLMGQKLPN